MNNLIVEMLKSVDYMTRIRKNCHRPLKWCNNRLVGLKWVYYGKESLSGCSWPFWEKAE